MTRTILGILALSMALAMSRAPSRSSGSLAISVAAVQFIRGVEMYAADEGGPAGGKPVESLEVVSHGVVASGIHEVEFI